MEPSPPVAVPTPWSHEATLIDPVPGRPAAAEEAGICLHLDWAGLSPDGGACARHGRQRPAGPTPVLLPRYGPPFVPGGSALTAASAALTTDPARPPAAAGSSMQHDVPQVDDAAPPTARTVVAPRQGRRALVGVLVALAVVLLGAAAVVATYVNRQSACHPCADQTNDARTRLAHADGAADRLFGRARREHRLVGPSTPRASSRGDGYHLTRAGVVLAPAPLVTSFDVSVRARRLKGSTSLASAWPFALLLVRGTTSSSSRPMARGTPIASLASRRRLCCRRRGAPQLLPASAPSTS